MLKGLSSVVVLKVERKLVIHSTHRQFLPDPRFEPTTSGYKSDARSIRPRLKLQMFVFQLYEVESVEQKVYVDESRFEPHTNYTVRVRSQPDQVDYKGVWSLWAPALHWRSGDIHSESVY